MSPTVIIDAPSDGATFTAGADITVQATANDGDGNVTGVELFLNGTSQGVDTNAPYQWILTNVSAGNYTIRTVATDNDGATGQDEISISVNAANNNNPTVSITNPMDGATFTQGTTVNVQATASDSDGSVTGVELFVDGTSRGIDDTAPYNWSVGNLSVGNHTLQVVATDNDGATAQDQISITVNAGNSGDPVVTFVRPNDGQTFPVGSDVIVEVDVIDDGSIQFVDLFLDGSLVRREGLPPYEWGKPNQPDNQLKNMAAGTYMLEAVATDNDGNTGSATISFTVSGGMGGGNMSPMVSFQTPTDGDNFGTGETINVLVDASDSDGSITGVQLFANGQNQGTVNTAPYQWSLSTNNPGTYTLRAVATDNDGATSEQSIMITVSNGGGGSNNPVVSFVTPMDGQTFLDGDDVPVEVNATDDGSVQFVDLFLDGTLVRRENGAPYEWGLPSQMDSALENMSPGTYTLEAIATDNQGNTGSATITFVVNSLVGNPPTVIFVVPTDGQNFTEGNDINVQASATDSDGTVTGVELFLDGVSQGVDNTDPYLWTLSGLAVGNYTLRLVATDNDSRTAQSEISISVSAANPGDPVVSFVMPTNGQDYPVGSDVVVEVNATDNGNIQFVDLFVDGTFFRRENTAPYEWGLATQMDAFFANMGMGTYNLEAVATDNQGNTGSASIFFTVGGGSGGSNIPPTVSITSPNDGDSFQAGNPITVNATASDADGSVTGAELFVDGTSQGVDATAPYSWDVTGLAAGSYTLLVRATDDENATAEDMIDITVTEAGLCDNNLTFNAADSPITSGIYRASQTITTNGQVSPVPAANVTFQAGQSITLSPGFSASPTSGEFVARIAPCDSGTNTPPMVSFAAPNDGDSFNEGSTINVQANASDSDGTVSGVELFVDGVSQGVDNTAPYQWAVTGAAVGNRTLRLVATDDANETAEATINIQVTANNTGNPMVTFVTPTNGQTFAAGSTVPVEVNATDSNGSVQFVELFLDGTLVRRENLAPWQWGFPGQNDPLLTNMSAGNYTLEAVATDNQGNTGSSSINITVTASGGNTPPQVSFSAPSNGQTFVEGDNVGVTVAASDSDGSVSTVELFYNGASQGTDNTSPYSWTINNTMVGTHTLRAVSTDDEGATSESTISINVTSNTSGSNARIAIENRTRTPFRELSFPSDTIYAFCNVRTWVPTMTDLHNRNIMRIHNEGTDNLIISNIEITDTSEFMLPGGEMDFLPLVIAPDAHYDLLIQFTETDGSRGVRKEIINLYSNAANKPVMSASLRGAYHVRTEGNSEPKIAQILEVLGFKTRLGSRLNSARYPTPADVASGAYGDIVVSKVWERADPNEPVIGFNLASYIGAAQGGGSNLNTRFVSTNDLNRKIGNFSFDTCNGFHQSILSKSNNCVSYDLIAGKESTTVDEPFRIVMDGYISDGQGEVEPDTGEKRLLGIRMYKVIDNAGNEIPNHYLALNDYVKNGCTEADGASPDDDFANCDWNDNVVYFINIKPMQASTAGNITLGEIEARFGEAKPMPSLRAYPNPAQDQLTVDLSNFSQERVTLRLQDQVGKVVYEQTFDIEDSTTERIDLAAYSNGLYILSLQTDEVQLTKKVIVNKAH
ncbi:MAG: Ig-like domain-containing protein [Bacteroidota bacterium]